LSGYHEKLREVFQAVGQGNRSGLGRIKRADFSKVPKNNLLPGVEWHLEGD
jgi:hypothetical protein